MININEEKKDYIEFRYIQTIFPIISRIKGFVKLRDFGEFIRPYTLETGFPIAYCLLEFNERCCSIIKIFRDADDVSNYIENINLNIFCQEDDSYNRGKAIFYDYKNFEDRCREALEYVISPKFKSDYDENVIIATKYAYPYGADINGILTLSTPATKLIPYLMEASESQKEKDYYKSIIDKCFPRIFKGEKQNVPVDIAYSLTEDLSFFRNGAHSSENPYEYDLIKAKKIADARIKFEETKKYERINPHIKERIMDRLNGLAGLNKAKTEIQKYIINSYINMSERRNNSLHMAFLGNPGTGKTTVARIVGGMMYDLGILPCQNFIELSAAELVSPYIGQTAQLTSVRFYEAAGGVLFIDEAYALTSTDNKHGIEAVNTLMKLMEDYRENTLVIFAGYKKEMENLFEVNPGFISRIPKSNYVDFDDYTENELYDIFHSIAANKKLVFSDDVNKSVLDIFIRGIVSDRDYANVRTLRNAIEELISIRNNRVYNNSYNGDYQVIITKEDIENSIYYNEKLQNISVSDSINELNNLIGISNVKNKIIELINIQQFDQLSKKMGLDITKHPTLNMVFTGNPGTGKTIVAKILGRTLKNIGFLKRDIFIDISATDIVMPHSGESSKKLESYIDKAKGGILFIDEAYELANSPAFNEIINVLLLKMEEYSNDTIIIFAGYKDKIESFLNSNPGLHSRIPTNNHLEFEDYDSFELLDILKLFIAKEYCLGVNTENELINLVNRYIDSIKMSGKPFGNAREMRNLADLIITCHKTNIINNYKPENITAEIMTTISLNDLKSILSET